jgi:hypothetical protein
MTSTTIPVFQDQALVGFQLRPRKSFDAVMRCRQDGLPAIVRGVSHCQVLLCKSVLRQSQLEFAMALSTGLVTELRRCRNSSTGQDREDFESDRRSISRQLTLSIEAKHVQPLEGQLTRVGRGEGTLQMASSLIRRAAWLSFFV